MEIVTSWMREGIEQGIERGIEQGIERGERSLVLRLLNRRVGQISNSIRSQLDLLSLEQLELLGEALLDFRTIADLETWLQNH